MTFGQKAGLSLAALMFGLVSFALGVLSTNPGLLSDFTVGTHAEILKGIAIVCCVLGLLVCIWQHQVVPLILGVCLAVILSAVYISASLFILSVNLWLSGLWPSM